MAWGLFAWLDIAQNSKSDPYNHFLFCNRFLLFVQYLHGLQMPSELGIRSFLSSQVFVCEVACQGFLIYVADGQIGVGVHHYSVLCHLLHLLHVDDV